jgi:hypothetical protein
MKIIKNLSPLTDELSSVHFFKNFYSKESSLIKAVVLETDDKSIKAYVLAQVFVDLTHEQQPYAIFTDRKGEVVFIELISFNASLEEIINKHTKFYPKRTLIGVGRLRISKHITLKDGKLDDLAAALLWAVDSPTNLSPKIGLAKVKEFLNPTR